LEIKKLAREGNNEGCKILAKQLVQLRKQKTRTYAASSKVWEMYFHILVPIFCEFHGLGVKCWSPVPNDPLQLDPM